MAGWTANSDGLSLLTRNVTVCVASLGGPALMLVAQEGTVCKPPETVRNWSGPGVKVGGWLAFSTWMVAVATTLLNAVDPPLMVALPKPPSAPVGWTRPVVRSQARNVNVAGPM